MKKIRMISGFRNMAAKGHPLTAALIAKFPDYEEETNQGYIWPVHYTLKKQLSECLDNIDRPKGKHPAQSAYHRLKILKSLERQMYAAGLDDDQRWDTDEQLNKTRTDLRNAEATFKEACRYVFKRDDNFAWTLQLKDSEANG